MSSGTDVLMRAQFFEIYQRRDSRLDSIKRLMFAALEDAVQCFIGHGMSVGKTPDESRASLQQAAEAWVADDSLATPFGFTFVQVCEVLNIDALALRRGLLTWRTNNAEREKRIPKARPSAGSRLKSECLKRGLVPAHTDDLDILPQPPADRRKHSAVDSGELQHRATAPEG